MQVFHMSFLLVCIPMGEVSGFMTGLTGSVNPQIKASFLSKSITGTTSYICSLSFKPFFSMNIKTERIFLCHYYIKKLEVSLCCLTGVATTPNSAEYCFFPVMTVFAPKKESRNIDWEPYPSPISFEFT